MADKYLNMAIDNGSTDAMINVGNLARIDKNYVNAKKISKMR